MSTQPLLSVEGLGVVIGRGPQATRPVEAVSFTVSDGEALGIVGESGSGKSLTLRAVLGLLPAGARREGEVRMASRGETTDAHSLPPGMAMIFQEPMTALNPTMRVGTLVAEPLRRRGLSRREARSGAVKLMREVGIPDAERRARAWPHELSGGLRQRVMIAAALATEPRLLLCDEPTTALDVCIQDQILSLLRRLMEERGMSLLFVSHDLAVVGELCDRVAIMYAGRIMEVGSTDTVLMEPRHPYTDGLRRSAPSMVDPAARLTGIEGMPPDPRAFPPGCRFAPRCPFRQADCDEIDGSLAVAGPGHSTACIHPGSIVREGAGAP